MQNEMIKNISQRHKFGRMFFSGGLQVPYCYVIHKRKPVSCETKTRYFYFSFQFFCGTCKLPIPRNDPNVRNLVSLCLNTGELKSSRALTKGTARTGQYLVVRENRTPARCSSKILCPLMCSLCVKSASEIACPFCSSC